MGRPLDRRAALEGALLGTFAGDAIGRPYEGASAVDRPEAEQRLADSLTQAELRYTDDTQLALALATHLVDHPDVEPEQLVEVMLDHFERSRGYGGGMYAVVEAWVRGAPIDVAAEVRFEGGSFGNGAAMRVAPLGVLHAEDRNRLEAAVIRASRPTHTHPVGIDGAWVQARAVALARNRGRFGRDELVEVRGEARTDALRGPLSGARRLIEADEEPSLPEVAQRLGNAVVAARSVPAALWIAATADDLEDAVVRALGVAGDTDTIGAMAAAIRGAAEGPDSIPAAWLERFEDGERGLTYARDLARRLADSSR
ncbi:MAG: ADP-ribosylglycohydrolase family protein [Nitriliruptorales bacterium]|nr:ADP-ribosylglycohydrolase family protein [Nitriliruptorales bacterium]